MLALFDHPLVRWTGIGWHNASAWHAVPPATPT
jgi:hypothetical protein